MPLITAPIGYRLVTWSQVAANELVYIPCTIDGKRAASGPFYVSSAENFTLRKVRTGSILVHPEDLLYRNGPQIVATTFNGVCTGIYADIALDLCILDEDLVTDKSPYRSIKWTRPQPFDVMPDVMVKAVKQTADNFPPLAGVWEVTGASKQSKPVLQTFLLHDRLTVISTVNVLIMKGYPVNVIPNSAGTAFEMHVACDALAYLRSLNDTIGL